MLFGQKLGVKDFEYAKPLALNCTVKKYCNDRQKNTFA